MRTKYLVAASAAVLVAAVAVAAPGQMAGRGMAKLDANSDGSITRAEINAQTAERFAKVDVNKDGFVTDAEIKTQRETMRSQWAAKMKERGDKAGGRHAERAERRGERLAKRNETMEKRGAEHFAARDANKDGRLSLAEFQADGNKRFDLLDADRNGTISQAELTRARDIAKALRRG